MKAVSRRLRVQVWLLAAALLLGPCPWALAGTTVPSPPPSQAPGIACRLALQIVTPLPFPNTPLDPTLDFAALLRDAGVPGRIDPNTIRVLNKTDGAAVPHAVTDDFAYGDKGRIAWVVKDPRHTQYEVQFTATPQRQPLQPQSAAPMIGVGDLLRYNAGAPRPITSHFAMGLADLRGTGQADLVGCWNYAYRAGDPWDGLICYPRVGAADRFEFGDMLRLRYVDKPGARDWKHFTHTYLACDFADFNHDGRTDMVLTRRGANTAEFYLNTGERDASGLPAFTPAGAAPVSGWEACRAVDMDGDGACDLVVNGSYVRNQNKNGWPFQPAAAVQLDAGREPSFVDLDGDGRPDSVCLCGVTAPRLQGEGVVPPYLDKICVGWRRNLGGSPPKFAAEQLLPDIALECCTLTAPARENGKTLLLVQHDYYQRIAVFELTGAGAAPRFRPRGEAMSESAVLALSDQAWPFSADWNGDGRMDLLVGGGYGFPRLLLNEGTRDRAVFGEAKLIEADGRPIRFLRNEILGEPRLWHNMGYPYPSFVCWDDDALPDLVFPNETNRVFWYKNEGTPTAPRFGARRQIVVEGYPDSPQQRTLSAQRAVEAVYPREKEVPFFWRTGAALADFNGDGLTDLVTLDSEHKQATLFAQFRDAAGQLRLRKAHVLKLRDGRPIDDAVVGRKLHWCESFRAVDWDGDGRTDLLYFLSGNDPGTNGGSSIYWLRNSGTAQEPVFDEPVAMCCYGEPIRITAHGPHGCACDFEGDGKPDLLTCVESSVYPFYRHAALMMKARPEIVVGRLELIAPRKP